MLKNYTVYLNAEETELFRLKYGNISQALRDLIRADVKPHELTYEELWKSQTPTGPVKCLRDIPTAPSTLECGQCKEEDCHARRVGYQY